MFARVTVAPVAVQMGPRNTRRLTAGAIAVGVAGAIAALLLLLFDRTPVHPSATSATRPAEQASSARLVFGMTEQQVRRLTGRPARTQGSCWLFHPTNMGMVGSISVQPAFARAAYNARTTGDLELCFASGAFSYGELHVYDEQHHKWVWGAWPLELWPAR